jgi:putative transposase
MEQLVMKTNKKHQNIHNESNVLEAILGVVDKKMTYGYRRVHAVVNQSRIADGLPPINHKRVYRLMKEHGLLLPKYGRIKPSRTHTGKVMTLKSNMRWCSDWFSILCDNGDQVHVAFSLDTCDREAMRYIASTKGIDGQMIRDLMLETVEYRFQDTKTPFTIQWLSDKGPLILHMRQCVLLDNLVFRSVLHLLTVLKVMVWLRRL